MTLESSPCLLLQCVLYKRPNIGRKHIDTSGNIAIKYCWAYILISRVVLLVIQLLKSALRYLVGNKNRYGDS